LKGRMSLRALEFVDNWIAEHVRPRHGIEPAVYAVRCYEAAAAKGIARQEIDEDGDLAEVIAEFVARRKPRGLPVDLGDDRPKRTGAARED
jgi:hypothetical protein